MTAVAVNSLPSEAVYRPVVAGSIGAPVAGSATPYPLLNTVSPPATTVTTAPGMSPSASWSGSTWSTTAPTSRRSGVLVSGGLAAAGVGRQSATSAGSASSAAVKVEWAGRNVMPGTLGRVRAGDRQSKV